jgi:hypothetical protein
MANSCKGFVVLAARRASGSPYWAVCGSLAGRGGRPASSSRIEVTRERTPKRATPSCMRAFANAVRMSPKKIGIYLRRETREG